LAPVLVIAVAIAGFVFGPDAVQSQLDEQLRGFVGQDGAKGIQAMIAAANKPQSGVLASVLGIAALLFGASGVFMQMKDALNTIWEVESKPGSGWWGMIQDRFLSFAMVLAIGFLLMVTLLVSAALAAFTKFVGNVIPGPDIVAHILDLVISVGIVTLLFALIFKYLPDIKIAWRDVWLGAAVTAVLFTIGKYAIGMYLGMAAVGSAYGAAGSLIVILVWAYYSSQILFFGAELTQAYSRLYGSQIPLTANAMPVAAEKRAQHGI
jgi:membrane protein